MRPQTPQEEPPTLGKEPQELSPHAEAPEGEEIADEDAKKPKKGFRSLMRGFAESEPFQNTIMFFILCNVIIMMADGYPPLSPQTEQTLKSLNLIFTWIFILEFIVNHLAFGLWGFWSDVSMAFDGFIVITSIIELALSGKGSLTALRGFRLLRVVKLAKNITSFRILVKAIAQTVVSLLPLFVVLALTIFVFTLMGMTFFATYFRFEDDDEARRAITMDGPYCIPYAECYNCPKIGPGCPSECVDCIPRAHFDELTWGLVTCFQILSGENWNTVMYDGMLAYRNIDGKNYEYVAILYFFGLVVFGQLIILNLFLAVLMSNFDEASSKIRKEEAEKRKEKQEARRKTTTETGRASLSQRASLSMQRSGTYLHGTITKSDGVRRRLEDCNLGLFGPDNPIRKWCEALIKSKGTFSMDNFILALIIISSVSMAFENPKDNPGDTKAVAMGYMNLVLTVIFTIEMLLKKIAFGAVIGKVTENGPYWRKPWNILDGGVVIIAVIDTLGIGQEYSAIKTLRVLRALRPLRVISRNQNLKLVVNTLFKSVPELCNLLVVAGLFLLIIGLFSVTYFKGKLYTCKAPVAYELDDFDLDMTAAVAGVMPLCIDINSESKTFGHLWPQGNVSDGEYAFGESGCA